MITECSVLIESVNNVPLPKLRSVAPSLEIALDCGSCSSSSAEKALQSGLDDFQVVPISLDPLYVEPGMAAHKAISLRLLLPVTWDDLLNQVRLGSTDQPPKDGGDVAQFGDVRVDFVRYEARRANVPVALTAAEFKILRFFVSNPHRVISRAELLDKVLGYDCYPTTRAVDNRILGLRQKLEREPANPIHFQTVHGAGYKFVPC